MEGGEKKPRNGCFFSHNIQREGFYLTPTTAKGRGAVRVQCIKKNQNKGRTQT